MKILSIFVFCLLRYKAGGFAALAGAAAGAAGGDS